MKENPILSGVLWFLGVSLLTGSGLLGIFAGIAAYTSAQKRVEKEQERLRNTERWQSQMRRKQAAEQNAYDQGYVDGYRDVTYQTQPYHTSLRPDDEITEARKAKSQSVAANEVSQQVQKKPEQKPMSEVEREAAKYIASLRLSRSEITNKDIQASIEELEKIVQSIYARLKDKPEQTAEVRAFMNKSMPLTAGVLDSYSDMAVRNVRSEEFIKMENEVLGLLETTKKAYTKLYANMYDGDIMDVTTEISVLKTMLSQEGLLENEMMGFGTAAEATGAFASDPDDPIPDSEEEGELAVSRQ